MGLGGSKMTPEEQMRENKRLITRAVREIDRERGALQTQEKKLVGEIKTAAQKGQMKTAKTMAKDLVRIRKNVAKFYEMKSNMQGVQLRLQTMKSTAALAQSMKGVTKAMQAMSKTMDMPELMKIMQEFSEQNEEMQKTEDAMGNAIDGALGEDEDEDEENKVLQEVFDEIGLDFASAVGNAPTANVQGAAVATPAAAQPQATAAESDLEARLKALRES